MADQKLPWRLGKNQRVVIEYLMDMNESLIARATLYREPLPDWKRGGGAITVNQLGSLLGFENWSEARRLLEGLADRGILAKHPTSAMYTLSQDALKETLPSEYVVERS